MGEEYSVFHAGVCIAALPLGSRLLARYDPRASWTISEYKLHAIACVLMNQWIPFPWEDASDSDGPEQIELKPMPVDEFDDWLHNNKWREVRRGII